MVKKRKCFNQQEVEALEKELASASVPYNYDTKEYPIEVILSKYDKGEIFVPPYQRDFIWKTDQKSKFIESLFLGVPIMPIFVSVSGDEAELEIIDGSQRIRTIVEYCNDKLKLQKLDKIKCLNGSFFSELPTSRQNKFKLRDIRFHVVTDKADSQTRADIFSRVNTSSTRLSPSEKRKGAYQSPFYRFIINTAQSDKLKKLCPIPECKAKRGEYEELVLRFFAYSEEYLHFKHDVAPFLDDYVKRHQKEYDEEKLVWSFNRMLDFVENFFPKPFFAKSLNDKTTPRVRFEALAVGVHLALEENPNLEVYDFRWLQSIDFKKLTTSDASNNPGRLKNRIEFVRDRLLGIEKTLSYADN